MLIPDFQVPPEARRERSVVWHDAGSVPALVAGLSGLQIMQGIRDGTLPPPPMARLVGFRCTAAEHGEVAMVMDHDASIENTMGMVHGGATATILDTAMGCAAHTTLPVGSGIVTLDLTITYLRPVTPRSSPVTAIGRVVNAGRRMIYVTGEVRDVGDSLVAHAVGNFSVVASRG
ncbi:PaaI family thioesterase (plasmid) [Novosphingobium resinovorum]|uniref:PaaI family thioesterase n=1 Tax=Novosphingobium TaxID=165696 RepID=UPI001B3C8FEA|nr:MULTISPECIES: PaaI family thioesterase [Novosphingobium]MBF7015055.1 PaaI family thioesterase [Novosphingobium sp. HR1a]WJM29739.1 PaaI family thioesterase [Novosphingobium resinovorum]